MPGGGGRKSLRGAWIWFSRFRAAAFCAGVVTAMEAGGGAQDKQALPRSAGHGHLPGDMMIDWWSPDLRG